MTTIRWADSNSNFFTKASGFFRVLSVIGSLAAGLLALHAAFSRTWCLRTAIGPHFPVTRDFSLSEIANYAQDMGRFSIALYLILIGATMLSVAAILCVVLWSYKALRIWIVSPMALGTLVLIAAWCIGAPTIADSYSGVPVLWSSGPAAKYCFVAAMLASAATGFAGIAGRKWSV